jgi:serine/threonine protein kinase
MTGPSHIPYEVIFTGQNLRLLRAGGGTACLIKTPVDDVAAASVLRQLDHEYEICRNTDLAGILRPTAKGTIEGRPAIVFDDPGGVPLAKLLEADPVHMPLFLDVAIELIAIIGRLHRKGVIHKDIHSGNIMVCTDGDPVRVYLTGLGIASLLPGQLAEKTTPNKLEGTLAVMSPEQTGRMNRPVDFRTDFYSYGVVLYQMLTGRLPFTGDDPLALVHAHLAVNPQTPDEINANIPLVLSDLVLKLLSKDADDRYCSAAGIEADLKRCRDDWRRTGIITAFELARQDVSDTFHTPDKS